MNNDARTEMYIYKGLSQKSHNPNFVSKLGLRCGGDSWTRTNDPIDVNDVLYRLSHATTCRFVIPTKVSYRLSHATGLFRVEQGRLYHATGNWSSSFSGEDGTAVDSGKGT